MKQRDIILVPFPFSDQSAQKIRPALVVSNDNFNRTSDDIVLCAVTSNTRPGKFSIVIHPHDIEEGILYDASAVKAETILKISKKLVIKTIARVSNAVFNKVVRAVEELIN